MDNSELRERLLKEERDRVANNHNHQEQRNDPEAQAAVNQPANDHMSFDIIDSDDRNVKLTNEEISFEYRKIYTSICLIVFGVLTFIIAMLAYIKVNGYSSSVLDFKHNWSLQPITDTTDL